jgi:hypothetical protein
MATPPHDQSIQGAHARGVCGAGAEHGPDVEAGSGHRVHGLDVGFAFGAFAVAGRVKITQISGSWAYGKR